MLSDIEECPAVEKNPAVQRVGWFLEKQQAEWKKKNDQSYWHIIAEYSSNR